MTTIINIEEHISGQCFPWPGDEPTLKLRARRDVEVGYLDGKQGPRTCCACRLVIEGLPVVSEGVPYHPLCYLGMRRQERADLRLYDAKIA